MSWSRRKKRLWQKARRVKWFYPHWANYYGTILMVDRPTWERFSYVVRVDMFEVSTGRFHSLREAREWLSWYAIQTVPHDWR